jgi:hypothetical protein
MKNNSRPKKQMHINRRQALCMLCGGGSILSLNPLKTFVNSMVDGIFMKAQAGTSTLPARNYFMLHIPGGPPRWVFDQMLNPYTPDSSVVQSPSVLNAFGPGVDANTAGPATYKTIPVTINGVTMNVPPLWGGTIPTSSGGSVPTKTVLQNFLQVRGINNPTASHVLGSYDKLRPSPSSPSIDGLVADATSTPVASVGITYTGAVDPTFSAFKSATGLGHTLVTPVDLFVVENMQCVSQLLSPFDRSQDAVPSPYMNRRAAMQGVINGALSQLGAIANSRQPGAETLFNVRNSAESLLTQGVNVFSAQYPALLAKYQTLINSCANYNAHPIPGVTDKVVPASAQNPTYLNQFPLLPDLRNLVTPSATVGGMPEAFAIAELLLVNGLSSSIVGLANGIWGVYFNNFSSPTGTTSDEHGSGIVGSLIENSFLFLSFVACLYEFSQVLTAKGLWSNTVVHFSSEFPRSPKNGAPIGSGTDHAPQSNLYSMFSGAITAPMVLGNVLNDASGGSGDPTNPMYGNWGYTAATNVGGAEVNLLLGHATSTLAALLRVPPIYANNQSLIATDANGDNIQAAIALAKNV